MFGVLLLLSGVICENFVEKWNGLIEMELFQIISNTLGYWLKKLLHKQDFYVSGYESHCRWEGRTLGTNGAGPLKSTAMAD